MEGKPDCQRAQPEPPHLTRSGPSVAMPDALRHPQISRRKDAFDCSRHSEQFSIVAIARNKHQPNR